jgi:energy-coupling factor transport system ATP-binding protein
MAIRAVDLGFRYAPDRPWVIRDVSFEVADGCLCVMCGPSGCGKSTLLYLLAGLLDCSDDTCHGSLAIGATQWEGRELGAPRTGVGLLMQDPARQLHQVTVFDEIMSGPVYRGFPWSQCVDRAAASARGLVDDTLWGQSPWEVSVGQQQRVALAAILATDDALLLLDEPDSCLDGEGKRYLRDTLVRLLLEGRTVIVNTHDVSWIGDLADSVLLLADGGVVRAGAARPTLYSPELDTVIGAPTPVRVGRALRVDSVAPPVSWTELRMLVTLRAPARDTRRDISETTSACPVAELTNASVYWNDRAVVSGISLTVAPGEALAVLGRNGTGKSSLARAIMNSGPVLKGQVRLPTRTEGRRLVSAVSVVSQTPADTIFETTCLREVAFGPKMLGRPNHDDLARSALAAVGLLHLQGAHPRALSAGQQKLLTIAAAIVTMPTLLVLDEPEYGLDRRTWLGIEAVLREQLLGGLAMILITHDLELAVRLCKRVAVFDNGTMAWSGPLDTPQSERSLNYLRPLAMCPDAIELLLVSATVDSTATNEEAFGASLTEYLCLIPQPESSEGMYRS